jgi:hypothetical protein
MTISRVQIQQVLNDEDIEDLLQAGAPSDEYEAEARVIAEAIAQTHESKLTEEVLTAVVKSTWAEMFGPFSEDQIRQRKAAFQRVARRLMAEQVGGPNARH